MTVDSPQPGQRPPAPGQLALLQAFLNTHFDLGVDWGGEVLHSPAGLRDWLTEQALLARGATVAPADLRRALALRRDLRAVIEAPQDAAALARLSESAAVTPAAVRFTRAGPRFVPGPAGGAQDALGVLAAITAAAMLDGTWSRLKLCPGEHCGWAFYDQSRNRSGRWCSMAVCGARTKARAHYARTRDRRRDP